MESQIEFPEFTDNYYSILKPSASVESSPPKSSPLSSSSETGSKISSSSISDDDVARISNLSISQDAGADYARLPMDCPTFVPQGILSSTPNFQSMVMERYPLLPSQPMCYPGGGQVGQPMDYRMWNFGSEIPPDEMARLQDIPAKQSTSSKAMWPGNERQQEKVWDNQNEQEANRNVFEFPVATEPPSSHYIPQTHIHVYSDRKINFADTTVPFVIQVLNPPQNVQMHPRMFQAGVRTPRGNSVTCRVRNSDSYIINSFAGYFKAEDEAGEYDVRVQLVLPTEKSKKNQQALKHADRIFHGSTLVAVSKNYSLDSQKECLRIPCEYRLPHRFDTKLVEEFEGEASNTFGNHPSDFAGYPGIRCKLWGLTCDMRTNNLLYTDREAHQVFCVSPHGHQVLQFGQNSDGPAGHKLNRPCGIVFDEARSRYIICDKDNHRICFFSLDGDFLSSFGYRGHKNGAFDYPWDVDVAPNGNIIVSDSKNKRIQLFDCLGNYLRKYTVFEVNPFEYKSQFDYPRGVCFDKTGANVFVTDFNVNNLLQVPVNFLEHNKILPNATLLRPQGVTTDDFGNLLVADSRHDCVRHMNTRGEHLSTIREVTKEPLMFPINVTTMAGGFLAVLNGNGSIVIF